MLLKGSEEIEITGPHDPTLPTGLVTWSGNYECEVNGPLSLKSRSRVLKKHLSVRRFATDAKVKQVVTSWLQSLDTDLFYDGIQALMPRWDKCLNVNGDYIEV